MKSTKNQPSNPFVLSGYFSSKYFCDREKETARILDAIQNHRNLTLLSLRRMGKTGLIEHIFNSGEAKNNYDCFYIDIYPTSNLGEFVKSLSKEIIGKLDSKIENIIKKAAVLFKSIHPIISFDSVTGKPEIEISLRNESRPETSLEELFSYLQQKESRVVIAIDEFQQITHYPEKNTEALLRSHIQHMTNVEFIYAGSQNHLLRNMFTAYNRPFYQSSELLFLQAIPLISYMPFVRKKMKGAGKEITPEAVEYLYNEFLGHTWYMQYTLNRLYTSSLAVITPLELKQQLDEITKENETLYLGYRNLLTPTQWTLLQSVAKEKGLKEPTSQSFTQKYALATGSVLRTLKALVEKEMIYEENGTYFVYNQFLSYWLRLRY
ncbi:MAG: ATP-binding protein [Candidatus Symbiothrix sp.]|jgi:AAA+ ATPase superfamily predicted ATPase|nr:ATP-binding protein [Candidatus Symbiothrix sp.]